MSAPSTNPDAASAAGAVADGDRAAASSALAAPPATTGGAVHPAVVGASAREGGAPAPSHTVAHEGSADRATLSPAANPGAGIDYELFLDCVHCGLCTASCPTYLELGNENDSPRGRIYLMRAVTDGRLAPTPEVRRHLDLCLDCRACETACPSGVQYGKLIEPFRVALEAHGDEASKTDDWFHRWILFGLFTNPARLRMALAPARVAQRLGLMRVAESLGLFRLLPGRLRQLVTMLPPPSRPQRALPAFLPAKGRRRARVALFTGCVADVMFRGTNWATAYYIPGMAHGGKEFDDLIPAQIDALEAMIDYQQSNGSRGAKAPTLIGTYPREPVTGPGNSLGFYNRSGRGRQTSRR